MDEFDAGLRIANKIHDLQIDRYGDKYILHPLRVAEYCHLSNSKVVALLHGVLKWSHYKLQDLEAEGFGQQTLHAVDCVTIRDNESLDAYFARIASSDIAIEVKFADYRDNSLRSKSSIDKIEHASQDSQKYIERAKKLYQFVGRQKVKSVLSQDMHEWIMDIVNPS